MTELQLQADCWRWYRNTFHNKKLRRIKNELDNHPRKNSSDIKKQLSENKATGIEPGTPDFMYLSTPMVWIEMKIEGGIQSPEQKEFQLLAESLKHHYFIIFSFVEFQQLMYGLNA